MFAAPCKFCNKRASVHVFTGIDIPAKPKEAAERQGFYCKDHDPTTPAQKRESEE
jgi:hypothetical protein